MSSQWQPERTLGSEKLTELLHVRVSPAFMASLKEFAKREEFDYSVSEAVRMGLANVMDRGDELIEGWHNTHWTAILKQEAKQAMKERERVMVQTLHEEWMQARNPIDKMNCEADAQELLEHCYLEASRETLRQIIAA